MIGCMHSTYSFGSIRITRALRNSTTDMAVSNRSDSALFHMDAVTEYVIAPGGERYEESHTRRNIPEVTSVTRVPCGDTANNACCFCTRESRALHWTYIIAKETRRV